MTFERLRIGSRLLVVTPDDVPFRERLSQAARRAVEGGAGAVLFRERSLCDADFVALAARVRAETEDAGGVFVVNERFRLAAAIGARAAHITARNDPGDSARARRLGLVVGMSVRSPEEARVAVREGAVDYLIAGTVYPTASKPGLTDYLGPGGLAAIAQAVTQPVFGIGGIDVSNAASLIRAGARGVAVMRGVFAAPDPRAAAAAIVQALAAEEPFGL